MENKIPILRYYKAWILCSSISALSSLQTRGGAIFFISGKLLRFFIFYLLIRLIGNEIHDISGFTEHELLLFFLTYHLLDTTSQLFLRGIYWFREEVIQGTFDYMLLKPIHSLFLVLTRDTDILDVPLFVIVIVWLIISLQGFSVIPVIMYSLHLVLSFCIIVSVHIFVAALGVHTTEVDHAIWIWRDVSAMSRIPVSVYVSPVREILFFILPVGLTFAVPVLVLLGRIPNFMIIVSAIATAFLYYISVTVWNIALRYYTSASS